MTSKISGLLVATMALVGVVGTSTRADAAFMALICDDMLCQGGGDTVVTDQGAGDNFPGSAQLGQINSGAISVAGFTVITNVSQSKPLIGSASAPQLDLTFSAVTSDNLSHTVYLYASDTGFTGTGRLLLTLGGTQSPSGDGNTIVGYAASGVTVASILASTGTTGATPFALSAFDTVNPTNVPYQLVIGVAITRGTPGSTTGDLNVMVPEPASMALFGLSLLGFATINRRRKASRVV